MRKSDKPYRFIVRSGRNIDVIFAHLPGQRMSTGTRDMTEAVLFAERFLEEDGKAKQTAPLLKDFAKDFFTRTDKASLRYRQKKFKKENRDKWYLDNQANLNNYIIPRFGDYPVDAISAVAVENWIVDFDGAKVKDLSGGTRVKVLNTFRFVLDDAVRMGYLRSNPAREGLSPSEDKDNGKRSLSIWEQNQLFPADPQQRMIIWGGLMWATYFSIMFDTGFRPDEVAGLQLGDVYQTPNGMAVYTSHTMNSEEKKPKERVKTSGKGVEKRVGLLSDVTEALVYELIENDKISDPDEYLHLIHRNIKDSWVFTPTSNKHFKTVAYRLLEIDEDDEERALTQYCLRHTFATYKRGTVDEQTLSIVMGHSRGVLSNYDHRDAVMVISQLDKSRKELFAKREEAEVIPVAKIISK